MLVYQFFGINLLQFGIQLSCFTIQKEYTNSLLYGDAAYILPSEGFPYMLSIQSSTDQARRECGWANKSKDQNSWY